MRGRILSAQAMNDDGTIHALVASDQLLEGRFDDVTNAAVPAERHKFGLAIHLTQTFGRYRLRIDQAVVGDKARDHGPFSFTITPSATIASISRGSPTGPGFSVGIIAGNEPFT